MQFNGSFNAVYVCISEGSLMAGQVQFNGTPFWGSLYALI